MYKKNSKMNVIVHVVLPHLNGGLFDAFEYYCCIKNNYDYDTFLYLIFTKHLQNNIFNKEIIEDIFKDKYEINDDILSGIKYIYNLNYIIRQKFSNLLYVDNHSFKYTCGRIYSKQIYFIVDPYIPSLIDYAKINSLTNVNIYSEMLNYQEDIFNE